MANTTASALNELMKQYNAAQKTYKPKTATQIRQQAEGEYKSYYDQLRLSAKQQQEQRDLALQQQREGLQRTYDKQREASEKNYRLRYSNADRQMLSRGMQRSSYAAQVLANIDLESAEATQDLWDQQGAAEGDIDAQRAQLAAQLAQQLQGYNAGQAADVLNRIRALEDQEYERGVQNQANLGNLSAQIYNIMYQQERDRIADQQWQMQFDASQKKKSSGGGGKKTTAKTTPTPTATTKKTSGYDSLINGLNSTTNTTSVNPLVTAGAAAGVAASKAVANVPTVKQTAPAPKPTKSHAVFSKALK